jgi:thiol-disulfide isomerase/thioredoxin
MEGLQIMDLNQDNISEFAEKMPSSGKIFIAFLAPWCGHCKNFKPEWEETKQHLNTIKDKASGHVVTVDDNLMQRLPCKQPSGFPTLSLYDGKEWKEDYSGARSKDALVEYLMNNMASKPKPKIQTQKRSRKGSRSVRHGRRDRRGRHRTRVRHNKHHTQKTLQWGGKKRKTKKQKYKCRKSRTMRKKRRC